jgi:hypothetical protein
LEENICGRRVTKNKEEETRILCGFFGRKYKAGNKHLQNAGFNAVSDHR